MTAVALMLVAGCGDETGVGAAPTTAAATTAAAAPAGSAPSSGAPDCKDVKGVFEQYYPLFVAVQGKALEALKKGDQPGAAEALKKQDALVREWTGLVEAQVAKVTQPDLHDALVTLLDTMRQYATTNGANAANVAKAAQAVQTALGKACPA
ncbi:hypothetical protein [Dactylosporangium sp. CA-139066]|uniref:hypothetical protein n=1 Tax=Dactylosporangium sp. CA-139066 TaxID=3239930 RepID=UPI003D9368B5